MNNVQVIAAALALGVSSFAFADDMAAPAPASSTPDTSMQCVVTGKTKDDCKGGDYMDDTKTCVMKNVSKEVCDAAGGTMGPGMNSNSDSSAKAKEETPKASAAAITCTLFIIKFLFRGLAFRFTTPN